MEGQSPGKNTRLKLSGVRREAVSFIVVGVINTLVGLTLMLLFYNKLHTGYWLSSAIAYVLASFVSYLLNRKYTFRYTGSTVTSILKFALNIAVCYVIAYTAAKPLVIYALSSFDMEIRIVEQIAMVFGMCVFTGLNFLGQKFFAFRKK
jgi:putative flippase GtrA